mmetsp:Transcript_37030/g.117870  ORF Transcript_37030/g.117870 Transcript_37030/m.117870 type:complete len:323 (-) Transcript_37030:466-1434(-)
MWVVALRQELHDAWELVRDVAHDKAEGYDGSPPHVVRHVRHGDVQQPPDRGVLRGPDVGQGYAEAGPVTEDGVLVQQHLLDQCLCLLFPAEHDHRQRKRARPDDLLVLRVVGVGQQLPDGLLGGGADHHEADGIGRGLARHRGVCVERLLQLLVGVLVGRGHADQANAEAGAVLQHLGGLGVVQLLQQVGLRLRVVVVRVDDAHGVEGPALGVWATPRPARLREVGAEDRLGLLDVALVDHTQGGCSAELCPVCRLCEPLEVLSEEDVARGAALHQAVAHNRAVVQDRVLGVDGVLDDLEEQEVRAVVPVEELQVEVDGSAP